uniref:carbonyl reductase (NADPH) n=2 Tax=Clastoptera arizonana TaxID=38151 RepID=A0A1B6CFB5_9HEMI
MVVTKVAVVTGGNKGIGYEIVKGLCEKFNGIVYLTARDVNRGKAAVEQLNKESLKPEFHQLDIKNKNSIDIFAKFLKEKHGGIDVLVNNAAIAFKHDATEPFAVQADETIATNYFALLDVCHALFPLLRPNSRVVNLSSSCGCLSQIPGKEIRDKFLISDMTEEKLNGLMKEFVEAAKKGDSKKLGWGGSAYVVSKVGVTALTFIQHRNFVLDPRENIIINAVHPGYVDTDMTSHKGPLTPQQGAEAPLYCALLSTDTKTPQGELVWKDKKVVDWENPPSGF